MRLPRVTHLARALRRGTAADGLPYKLTLILNGNCPTRCSFCSIWKTPSPDEMTPDEWEQVFAGAPRTTWANLSGGEIFLRSDLPAIVDALVRRMPDLYLVDFPTTGWHPQRVIDVCRQLVDGGVRKVLVTVSLDGPPELHDRLRGREGAHERACAAMRALREASLPRVRAFFGMTLLPENHDQVEQTKRAAKALVPGLDDEQFHFNIGMESGHYYRNEGAGTKPPKAVLDVLASEERAGYDPVSLLERAYQSRVEEFLRTGRSPVPCTAVRASVFVDAQGTVYPCSIYSRPLGSLREHDYSLRNVLGLAEATAARQAVIDDACPGCWTPCEAYQSLFAHYLRSE
ncbi:MAG: radical SAM protein [Planctomycetota bacterium]|jgi:MoaA/NifB/PqqE/SkfB family radical SAM enzyme